jgi:hypothetical protein
MPEACNPSVLKELIESVRLRVAAFGASDWNDETIAVGRNARIDLYVDRLGVADTPKVWQDAVNRGHRDSDRQTGGLVLFLRAKGFHK